MEEMLAKWYGVYTTRLFNEEQRKEFMEDIKYYNLDLIDVMNTIYTKYMSEKGVNVKRDISTNK